MHLLIFLLLTFLASFSTAVPVAPAPTAKALIEERDLLGEVSSVLNPTATTDLIDNVIAEINSAVAPTASGNIFHNILTDLQLVSATAAPTEIFAARSTMSKLWRAHPTPTGINDMFNGLAQVVEAGLTKNNLNDIESFLEGAINGENSMNNINIRNPNKPVYPKADWRDAPYDLTEAQLRGAIYIPPTFRYGAGAQPVILVPGTGDTGYTTFIGSYIPLLQGPDAHVADPVWLNIPGYLLNDAQTNAEYVAYAINYIYGVSNGRQIAVAAWSQGNIDAQWAYKYWPSTRSKVTDHVALSPDYHGTVFANYIATPDVPLPPSLIQQEYNSNFITTMRANGGDSAYVPTTTIYSGFFDEIVEPQQGLGASAYLLDARRVGVSNNEVQTVCADQVAGTFYTHEGTLYNPLGYALFKDALAHPGPGQASRLNLADVCSTYLTPGLNLADFLLTENSIAIAGYQILTYPNPTTVEPLIRAYAKGYVYR